MKKLLCSISISALLTLDASVINENMKSMRDGLLEIQDGFLYNNKNSVIDGINKIKIANEIFSDKASVAIYLTSDKKRMSSVTLMSSKRLSADLDAMSEYISDNKMLEAAELHSDVIKDCTRCHAIVRDW